MSRITSTTAQATQTSTPVIIPQKRPINSVDDNAVDQPPEMKKLNTLEFLKPAQLQQNVIYTIETFKEFTSEDFGKSWHAIITGGCAISISKFYMDRFDYSLDKFGKNKHFLIYAGQRQSRAGFVYSVVKFPKLTNMETACLCNRACILCECHSTDLQHKFIVCTCVCTLRKAENKAAVKNKISQLLYNEDEDEESADDEPKNA